MGIPVYFKTLVSEYHNIILHKSKLKDINYLFLDLNCLIHPCCRGLTDENEMIEKILSEIQRLIDYTEVSKLVYIAIDGIAPKGKMKQQRMRRYKNALERKYSDEKRWNTNAISPGTFFMRKLNNKLKNFIKENNKNIILSDSDERGEGEHKILQYIKKNKLSDKISIYGLDADLIMLSLVSRVNNIYLLRERTEYNIENTDEEFIYLNIDELKRVLLESLNLKRIIDKNQIIDDYIFICFLLGNDFMNHIPSLNLRYNGHNILLEVYSLLQERYQGYFSLIDNKLENYINLLFFKEFINELTNREQKNISSIISIRQRQNKKLFNEYNEIFQDFKKYIQKENKDISLENIYEYQYHNNFDKEMIIKFIDNLPLLYSSDDKNIYNDLLYNEAECIDHLNSLIWTTHYYFGECIHWKWSTEYNRGPLLKNYNQFLTNIKKITFQRNNQEFTNKEQLSYIFPNDSHKLHEYNIKTKEYKLIPDLKMNRYLWECHLEFI